MPAPKPDFNAWVQMLGMQGQNMSPASAMQMSQQSSPGGIGGMSLPPPDDQMMSAPPPPPQIIPVAPQRVKATAQPTRQPIGTVPQETVPQQPAMVGSGGRLSLADEIELASKNYGEGLSMNQDEIDKMKAQLSSYQQSDRGIDFTPLAALSDAWFGGNLAAAAKATAPESEVEKRKNMADMQAKIVAAQKGLSDAEREGMQQRLQQLGYQEQRKSNKEIALINAAARDNGIVRDRLLQKQADKLDNDTQKLEKRIGDITPGIVTKLKNLDALVPGGIEGNEETEVPGVGPGQFLVPDFMMGADASDIQQNARGLAADLIKLQSGTAASDKEVDRKMKELGMSSTSKSSTFRSGIKRLRQQLSVELKNKEAGFRPEVKEAYTGRGGITHESVLDIGKKAADTGDDLNANLDAMSPEQLKAWMKKHGGQ